MLTQFRALLTPLSRSQVVKNDDHAKAPLDGVPESAQASSGQPDPKFDPDIRSVAAMKAPAPEQEVKFKILHVKGSGSKELLWRYSVSLWTAPLHHWRKGESMSKCAGH